MTGVERPWAYSAFPVEVRAIAQPSPRFLRFTFTGDALAHFATWGLDQRIKLVLPMADGSIADFGLLDEPTPHPSDWYTRWKALPSDARNVLRTYTPAAIRPGERELDVDFFLHTPEGPASAWARTARIGDRLAITGPDARMGATGYGIHWVPGDARRFLLIGDETAYPAIRNILASLDADALADVVLISDHAEDDLVSPSAPAQARIVRVAPEGPEALDRAVLAWGGSGAAADPDLYAWIAGESATTLRARRLLTADLGVPRERVAFLGYWRSGGPLVD